MAERLNEGTEHQGLDELPPKAREASGGIVILAERLLPATPGNAQLRQELAAAYYSGELGEAVMKYGTAEDIDALADV